jgi:hamartin protein
VHTGLECNWLIIRVNCRSLKDILKTLDSKFQSPTLSYPLPEDLEQTIEQFVHAHQDIEDTDSQRLHEELVSIFNRSVIGNVDKYGPFVTVLRLLRTLILGQNRLEEWWTLVIRPTIDAIGHKRDTIEDAKEFLLGVLVFDPEDDISGEKTRISALFTQKLLDAYLSRTRLPAGDDVVSPEDEFIAHELEGILVSFGRKMPKELLLAVDDIFVIKERRLQALSLLSSFVRLQPPHLHLVLETKVIKHLHTCLLVDNSSTVVDLALTILIMFIPHITSILVADLPTLFVIYSRILCWDQYSKRGDGQTSGEQSESDQGSEPEMKLTLEHDPTWDQADVALDGEQSSGPKPNYLFTFLYGLFPLNFMNFIRKPRRYLKMKGYSKSDQLDLHQNLIRTRTEVHRVQHRLHPNFFTTTPEDELADNRWVKSDPAELVSECLNLCIAVAFSLNDIGPPPSAKLPPLPRKLKQQSSRTTIPIGDEETLGMELSPVENNKPRSNRNTLSTTLTAPSSQTYTMDSTRVPRQSSHQSLTDHFARTSRNASPHEPALTDNIVESPTEMTAQTPRFTNISRPPSPSRSASTTPVNPNPKLLSFAQTLSRFPVPSPDLPGGDAYNTAILQREVMLLKNQLTFEKFQKQKYVEQIGHLQRKAMGDISIETDTQTLMNKNRNLKARLAKFDERYEQLKKEMATSRNQAKRYEDQLTARLKALKEEERQWHIENESLRHELLQVRKECEELKKMVVESEHREHDSKNELGTLQHDLEEMSAMRNKLHDMSSKLREYEHRDLDFALAQEQHQVLQMELETAVLRLNSSDAERERMRIKYEQKIFQLEANARNLAQSASPNNSGLGGMNGQQVPATIQQMIDSALAVSQNKIQQLKKQYGQLQHRYLDLELRNQELESNGPRPGSVLSLTRFADDSSSTLLGSRNDSRNDNLSSASPTSSRDSFISGILPARSRSYRVGGGPMGGKPQHDFANPENLIVEEEYDEVMRGMSMGYPHNDREQQRQQEQQQQQQQQGARHFTSAGLALFPALATASATSSRANTAQGDRDMASPAGSGSTSMHDFQSRGQETLATSVRYVSRDGDGNGGEPQLDPRSYGRGKFPKRVLIVD